MNVKKILFIAVVVVAVGGAFYLYGGHSTPKGQQALVSFSSGDLASLKSSFNNSAPSVRVLLMLSPT
jgi:hypothetical protein